MKIITVDTITNHAIYHPNLHFIPNDNSRWATGHVRHVVIHPQPDFAEPYICQCLGADHDPCIMLQAIVFIH